MYGDVCLVASGGQLQKISSGSAMQIVAGSPLCNYVTSRVGRVIAWHSQSDIRNYSAIGDYANWTNNPSDPSSSQYVNIGYKDPGNIIAECTIANMVLVFKDKGRVYQILGEPQDSGFSALPFSETGNCMSQFSAVPVDNKAFYLGRSGFMNFVPTQAYGNVTPQEAGLNINAMLAKITDSSCRIFHIQPKKQIWLKTQNDNMVYIYHYTPRYPYDEATGSRGAWTTREFKYPLNDVMLIGNDIYIAYGNKIGVLDSTIDRDDDIQIQTLIMGKDQLPQKRHLMVRSKSLNTQNRISGYGTLTLGKKPPVSINFGSGDQFIGDAEQFIGNDDSFKDKDSIKKYYKPGGGGGNDSLQYTLLVQKGAVSVRNMDYTYSEV
jgi:hypothetical protein